MEQVRPEQLEVVVAAPKGIDAEPARELLARAGFQAHSVEVGLSGLSRVAEVKPRALVLMGLSEPTLEWVLNFVEGNPESPAILTIAEIEELDEAPEWLYDIVRPDELGSALVHRTARALAFDDMRKLAVQRSEELGLSGAQLRMVSMIDVVTGLFNRRYFRKHLRESYAAARRYKRPLTLLLMRIQSYRTILQSWGPERTNDILDSIALGITNVIRESDIAARIDEDLFGFLLPETTAEGASGLVQRLTTRIKTAKYPHDAEVDVRAAHLELDSGHSDAASFLDAALEELP